MNKTALWVVYILELLVIAIACYFGAQYEIKTTELSGQINILLNQTPLSKPLLEFQSRAWGEATDEKSYTLNGFIWNYGELEANNVEVTCGIFDKDKKLLDIKVENLGNVASNSWTFKQIAMEKKSKTNIPNVSAICYYTNSSNGYALESNIKELV